MSPYRGLPGSDDPSEWINPATLNKSVVDDEKERDLVSHIVSYVEDSGEAVSLENFIAAIDYKLKLSRKPSSHLFVSTSARDRNSELKRTGPSEEEEVTFTPRIDPHSARLLELHRSRAGPIYDQLVAKKRMSQVRIEELRKEKERRDLDGCTFHPDTRPPDIHRPSTKLTRDTVVLSSSAVDS
ncbi:hypothetical protein FOZ62_011831 [Perkinsus olseni]|uniref:Uncharacterized protein n=1 Tax=Perkinsus olseni TaxID=32597 RepID=A0A7J6SA05_PEROL|nr:hypothetical protein FOZ62_011831 [Perkinsus olseni]